MVPASLWWVLALVFPIQEEPAGGGAVEPPPQEAAGPEEEPPGTVQLDALVVTPSGGWHDELSLPLASSAVDRGAMLDRLPQTVPDAVSEEVGVFIQKTSLGGGSPIIRGRSGKDVLLLLDSQRFNNSTFRRNHQYLNTLSLGAVQRIEVIRGPASVLYGSDAMGGAINVITRRHEPGQGPRFGGSLFGQFQTADQGFTSNLDLEAELGSFGVIGGVGYQDINDLRAGRYTDPAGAVDRNGRQRPTAYRGTSAWAAATQRITDQDHLDFFFFRSQQNDVPRSDVIIPNDKEPNPPDKRRDSDPQVLEWYELTYRRDTPGETVEGLTLTATLNDQTEARRRIRVSTPTIQTNEHDRSFTPGFKAQAQLRPHDEHLLTTGLDLYLETVDSTSETVDLATGAVTPGAFGRYPDDSTYQSYGVFLQDEWEIDEDWIFTGGVRYSLVRVRLDLEGLTVGPAGPFGRLDDTYQDVTFATGLSYRAAENTWVYGSVSRGFRAPNLDDLAVLGDFSSGERVPNLDLDPESVLNFELGVKHRGPRLRAGAATSLALYQDLFDQEFVFTLNNVDFFQIENVARARIFSVEGWLEHVLCESEGGLLQHILFGNAYASFGRNTTDDEPVSKVPPPVAEMGYRLAEAQDHWFVETFARGALEQDRLSAADEADPRFPLGGTPAWVTLNLRGAYEFTRHARASVALENLLDRRYRVHGSGIDAPGTNLVLQLELTF